MFLGIELCLVAILLALAYTRPPLGDLFFSSFETRFARFAKHTNYSVLAVGLIALALRAALLPILPIPAPDIHDEFSHLLLADTLAHGRLANPTHPMWIHFETFHVNWHPTYASMYCPGHAFFLALGQVIMGHPFWGVWLSSGLMCAAICWALQGWMAPQWALLGGLLAVVRLGSFSYWADSYWGGTVTALAGALVLGAFPRVRQTQKIWDAVILGAGMALLALTRPYEGLFLCVPIVVFLLVWARRKGIPRFKTLLVRIGLPATLTLAIGLAWLAYYFWRVTGSPFTSPYQINIRTYGLIYFPWQHFKQVAPFHHLMMQLFYRDISLPTAYNYARQHPFKLQGLKILVIWLFFFGPLLTMPWLAWIFTRPRKQFWSSINPDLRLSLVLCVCAYASLMLTIYVGQPHYAAPFTAVFYLATVLVLRELWLSSAGRWLVRSMLPTAVALFVLVMVAYALHAGPSPSWIRIWCTPPWQNLRRAQILNDLRHTPGDHLVIVRYRPDHDFAYDEWVFNRADINGSKVIWARDMGSQNAELINYFGARKVWLVEPDRKPVMLVPYPSERSGPLSYSTGH
jgi:hypothetical protein